MSDLVAERPYLFLGSRLRRLAERMQAEAAQLSAWAGAEVPAGLYAVLVALQEQGPQSIGDLARALGVSQPAATKSVARLVRAELVEAGPGTVDRRQSLVSLTPAGASAIAQGRRAIWPLVEAAVREVVDDLSGPLLDQIQTLERRLAEAPLSQRALSAAPAALRPATDDEIPAVAALLNRAYRGVGADASWCVESGYIEGERTNAVLLRQELADKPNGVLLVWDLLGAIQGSVWLEPLDAETWYLGSLAVNPRIQNAQLGRRLLAAAEDWARERGATAITMTVVNVRQSLLDWYERRGYRLTGQTEPFPYDDARFGRPTRPDLCFLVLTKAL